MPLYEYYCPDCKKTLEVLQKISDPIKKKCPSCSGRLKKLISESAFQLKGTGWYKTDYAAKPTPKGSLQDQKEEPKPADKKEEKTESKVAGTEKKKEVPKEAEKKKAASESSSPKS